MNTDSINGDKKVSQNLLPRLITLQSTRLKLEFLELMMTSSKYVYRVQLCYSQAISIPSYCLAEEANPLVAPCPIEAACLLRSVVTEAALSLLNAWVTLTLPALRTDAFGLFCSSIMCFFISIEV